MLRPSPQSSTLPCFPFPRARLPQSAVDVLPGLEQSLIGWEAASGGAVSQLVALLRSAPHAWPVDPQLAAQRAAALTARRQQWLAESRALVTRLCQVRGREGKRKTQGCGRKMRVASACGRAPVV